nr:MAG TPA: hypothetical protein [Caudoviricetes sp.]
MLPSHRRGGSRSLTLSRRVREKTLTQFLTETNNKLLSPLF